MTVYFSNYGNLDLDTIRVMGVSVKTTDNPIGYFGTGLKYALATLLRTGHKVKLTTGGESFTFGVRQKLIRDKPFNVCTVNGDDLPFTTDLGKNWEVWQAYRELHSNTLDEGGSITDDPGDWCWDTVIEVRGKLIQEAFRNRHQIFLPGEPRFVIPHVLAVYEGETNFLYYRGVRVKSLPNRTKFTYNFLCDMELTEDRTLASVYDATWKLSQCLPAIPSELVARRVLSQDGSETFENDLDWSMCGCPSEEFLDYVEKNDNNLLISSKAKRLLHAHRDVKHSDLDDHNPTVAEMNTLETACDLLWSKLNVRLSAGEVTIVPHLGPNVMAGVRDGKIYITCRALANGVDYTLITLYEEWIHRDLGYADCSRGMQQHLFDKILELIKMGFREARTIKRGDRRSREIKD